MNTTRSKLLIAGAIWCALANDAVRSQPAQESCLIPNTAPALTGSPLRAGVLKIVAGFDPVDWHGELAAYAVDESTGSFKTIPSWKAHEQLNAGASGRAVITNNGAGGVRFAWDTLDAAKRDALKAGSADEHGAALLRWLRGDNSDAARFRIRAGNTNLGAIVHSNPVVQGPPRASFFGPRFAGYGEFASTWAQRKNIVWVGAADGMLHAFDASSGAEGGKPLLSYVPEALFARLPEVARPARPRLAPMVDGSPFVSDVRTAAGWSTYLFAPMGRGAKAIVALDVTDPAVLADESKADKVFRWQFTSADDAGDLGHIVAEPTVSPFSRQSGQVALMNNGKFAVLVGNGVTSTSGRAVLYILFADGPSDKGDWTGRFVKLVADGGPDNGLSQPVWVDQNNDGVADAVYAGDLKGHLWKFDVSERNPADWKVAYGGKPLFIAQDAAQRALPISAAPEFRFHPDGGTVLLFAGGQALFGIWDKPAFARTPIDQLDTTLPRAGAQLEARRFRDLADGAGRQLIGEAMDWTRKPGWHLPLVAGDESTAANLLLANGHVAFVTRTPGSPRPGSSCATSGASRLTWLNVLTGLPVTASVVSMPIDDHRIRIVADRSTRKCSDPSIACSRLVGPSIDREIALPNSRARIFWRELSGLRTHQ